MSELHAISKPEGAKADVVFIHGLGDDPFKCWQHDQSKPEDSWPYWLVDQRQDVAVWTLDYDANKSYWTGDAMSLPDRAKGVLTTLELEKLGDRPIVFVCHSLGGLVAKQLLRTASDNPKPAWKAILNKTTDVIFLATPHVGSYLATWFGQLGKISNATEAIKDLKKNAPTLRNLNEWYRGNSVDLRTESHVFFETQKTVTLSIKGFAIHGVLVVEESSADPGITGVTPIPLEADHRSIVKPDRPNETVCQYLETVIEDALNNPPCEPNPDPSGGGPEQPSGTAQTTNTEGDRNVTIQISGDGSKVDVHQGPSDAPAPFDSTEAKDSPSIDTLPTTHSDFIGRDADIEEIRAALLVGSAAVTTVIEGMGGIGKTVTGLQVARALRGEGAFPDGVLFVDLFGFTEGRNPLPATDALVSLLRQLVGSEAKLPDELGQLQHVWRQATAGKQILLFLDNARDVEQIEPLLPGHPECRVLTTSRNRFTLPGLKPIELGLLAENEAIELAMTHANQRWPGRLSETQAKILADRCGLHPLAIEVTASALGAAQTYDVEEQLDKLGNAEKDALNMDEVKAILRLSVDLLNRDERASWRRLGLFEGDFDAKAAKAVMDAENADDILATLETRNLLTCQNDNRLQLHDILRAISLEDLDPVEREAAGERHSRHYKDVLAAADDLYLEGKVLDGLRLYDREQHQIQVGQTFAAARIESSDNIARLAADYAGVGTYVLMLRFSPRDRIVWHDIQAEACRKLGDRRGEGSALGNLGLAYADLGEPRRAIEYYEQALVILREVGSRQGEGAALGNLGIAYKNLGEPRRAIEFYEQQLVITREIGDRRGEGNALGNFGNAYADLGELGGAIEFYEQQLVITREIGDRRGEARALYNGADEWKKAGERAKAIDWLQMALAIEEAIEDPTVDQTHTLLAEWTAEPDAG